MAPRYTNNAFIFLALLFILDNFVNGEMFDKRGEKSYPSYYADVAAWPSQYPACGGMAQSPINVDTTSTVKDAKLTPFSWTDYTSSNLKFSNKVKFEYNSGPTVKLQGGGLPNDYEFLQAHYHWSGLGDSGSEHTINGLAAPLELHLVHKIAGMAVGEAIARSDGLAVVGYLIVNTASQPHAGMSAFLEKVKDMEEDQTIEDMDFSLLLGLVPAINTRYFRYQGSLTTPQCQEAVVWTLVETPVAITRNQYTVFKAFLVRMGQSLTPHFRPPQPLYGRTVYASVNNVEEQVSYLQRELLKFEEEFTKTLTKLTTPQYFSVFLASHKDVAPGHVVVFDGVIDDPDNLYSNTTGEFTCQVPGLYVFTLNVMSQHGNGVLWLAILVNGAGKATTHANGRLDQASQTLTAALKAGDEVKVIGVYQESHVYGAKWVYSTFTGRLVTPAPQ